MSTNDMILITISRSEGSFLHRFLRRATINHIKFNECTQFLNGFPLRHAKIHNGAGEKKMKNNSDRLYSAPHNYCFSNVDKGTVQSRFRNTHS
jgi:hypothetical protein